jgi:hypothetical protein
VIAQKQGIRFIGDVFAADDHGAIAQKKQNTANRHRDICDNVLRYGPDELVKPATFSVEHVISGMFETQLPEKKLGKFLLKVKRNP